MFASLFFIEYALGAVLLFIALIALGAAYLIYIIACLGEGWVCEFHPDKPWEDGQGCCGGAGKPCKCNPLSLPINPGNN